MKPDSGIDQLVPSLYEKLRSMAHHRLRAVTADHSLNTTGLVHEAYLRLAESRTNEFANSQHFLATASRVMRSVLVDHARANGALKRGSAAPPVAIDESIATDSIDLDSVIDVDDALRKLEQVDSRQSAIIECRYFGGLSLEETAEALELSLSTVNRELRLARAWLATELTRSTSKAQRLDN